MRGHAVAKVTRELVLRTMDEDLLDTPILGVLHWLLQYGCKGAFHMLDTSPPRLGLQYGRTHSISMPNLIEDAATYKIVTDRQSELLLTL